MVHFRISHTPHRANRYIGRIAAGAALTIVLGLVGCGRDRFTVEGTRDNPGRGGMSGGGGELQCCFGGAGEAGKDGGGGSDSEEIIFDGACSLSLAYCAVDWVGALTEPGFSAGVAEQARFSELTGVTSAGGRLYVTHENGVSVVDPETREVTLLAGGHDAGDQVGGASEARFNRPSGIAHYGGFLYVSDTGNRKIKRIDVETGEVSTYLTQFVSGPAGLTILPPEGGNPAYLIIAEEVLHIIVRVELAERAPTPGVLSGTINTPGSNAVLLNAPHALSRVGQTLYITERGNHWVRSLDLTQASPSLKLVWGAGEPGSADGEGASARLSDPRGITADGGVLYIADAGNSVIRRGVPGASLEVVAGTVGVAEHVEGVGQEARFSEPRFLHVAEDGDAYLAEGTVLRRLSL